MEGMLHPTSEGIQFGILAGLKNPEHISTYIIQNETDKIDLSRFYTKPASTEYYIGYGSGYEQGHRLRLLLKNDTSNKMSLDNKVELLAFLLREQRICRQNLTQLFMDNIQNWEIDELLSEFMQKLISLLALNKIQMTVDKLLAYYKENFHLKSLMEFYPIYKKLTSVRRENRSTQIQPNYLDEVKTDIQHWISLR